MFFREHKKAKPLTDEQKAFIDENYDKMYLNEMAKKIPQSINLIRNYMKFKGYKARKLSGYNPNSRYATRKKVKEGFFDPNQPCY